MITRLFLLSALLLTTPIAAQDSLPVPPAQRTRPQAQVMPGRTDWMTRLTQVGHFIRMGSHGRAATMLEELEKTGAPRNATLPQWIALAAALDDQPRVVELCEEGLTLMPGSARLLRSYAMGLMAVGRLGDAQGALDRLLAGSPNKTNVVIQAVGLWREGGHPERGLALCDSVRAVSGSRPDVLRRPRGACLIELGRIEEGTTEIVGELGDNPLNLMILRQDVLGLLDTREKIARAAAALDRSDAGVEVVLLRIDLLLMLGRGEEAERIAVPLTADRDAAAAVLRMIGALTREAPLIEDSEVRRATVSWLLTVLDALASSPGVDAGQRPQILDMLAGAAQDALELGLLDHDPDQAVARLERVLDRVRAGSPGSSRLYSAQILLARFTRDVLGRPAEAADRLTRLLTNLDLPLRGVALCRLELGVSHLAACDTARARVVLRRLGRSSQFPEASGPAHYHLARLDLAQGLWESARDRLAAVALDDPRADLANDALELALVLAEELDRPAAGGGLLEAYAPVVAAELCRRQDDRRDALASLLQTAAAMPGMVGESALVDRARLELGELEAAAGRYEAAADLAAAVASDHPDGGAAAGALLRQGRWLVAAGDAAAARLAWERLVIQYPDDLATEDARTMLRELP